VAADIKAPERVLGFFTVTAGLDVLGVRLALAGHPLATAILAGRAAAAEVVLTYGVPASLLLHQGARFCPRRRQRVLAAVDRRHAVPVDRGGDPGPGLALTDRAACPSRRRAMVS
jgi:hypothetical protein